MIEDGAFLKGSVFFYRKLNRDFALKNFSRQQITEEKVPAKSTASSQDIVKKSGGSSQISLSNEKFGLNIKK